MGLICPHTATSAVCAQLIISLLLEGFLITHQDSDAKKHYESNSLHCEKKCMLCFLLEPTALV